MMVTHCTRSTPVARPHDREVDTFNAALEELGIEWRLDTSVYAQHHNIADARTRLCACIEAQYPHLLKAYDRDFIGNIVSEAAALQSRALAAATARH